MRGKAHEEIAHHGKLAAMEKLIVHGPRTCTYACICAFVHVHLLKD